MQSFSSVTAVTFDPFEEILWTGLGNVSYCMLCSLFSLAMQGRLVSYVGQNMERYTSVQAHNSEVIFLHSEVPAFAKNISFRFVKSWLRKIMWSLLLLTMYAAILEEVCYNYLTGTFEPLLFFFFCFVQVLIVICFFFSAQRKSLSFPALWLLISDVTSCFLEAPRTIS